jgi:spore coat protein CotH
MKPDQSSTTVFAFRLLCITPNCLCACGSEPGSDPPEDLGHEPEDPHAPAEDGCHEIYAQDLLPTFELTIDEDTWEALEWEWKHGAKQEIKGENPKPHHSLTEFRYGDIVIDNAEIRLRGNPTHWDQEGKLQFQITFDRVDENGHFLGLEALAFDAAPANRNMQRDRLALSIMRDMGIPAPCANHARLDINGEYYGIFTNLEKVDKKFLERRFDDPSGDLWKRGNWELETNKKTANVARLAALLDAETIDELETHLDVEHALRVYASEAILPASDNGWAGGLNFYLYDDPISGVFKLIPYDLDGAFDRFNDGPNGEFPANPDPVVWHKKIRFHGRPWYDLALEDEDWFWYYIESIEVHYEAAYDVSVLRERIATWTDQIEESVLEDDNKSFSNEEYLQEVELLVEYVEARHEWLGEWLKCWEEGGEPDNKGHCEQDD